uniref:Uncharacterized protein n=1 Tax=Heterorhabditis bacteriophora TaxID=37862 RepID=A0A1I7WPN4_HETBA
MEASTKTESRLRSEITPLAQAHALRDNDKGGHCYQSLLIATSNESFAPTKTCRLNRVPIISQTCYSIYKDKNVTDFLNIIDRSVLERMVVKYSRVTTGTQCKRITERKRKQTGRAMRRKLW